MAVKYFHIKTYMKYLDFLKKERRSFRLETTNYTKKIIEGTESTIFNNEGESDFELLSLINRVRSDAKLYMNKHILPTDFDVNYFDMSEKPPKTVVSKIDIRGAYWSFALKTGIISEKTNKYLIDTYGRTEMLKRARLKALGSLATHKRYFSYVDGVHVEELFIEKSQDTRDMYIMICQGIDQVMKEIIMEIPGAFYYYWDCIFCDEKVSREVEEWIKKKGYMTTTSTTRIETIKIGNYKYLFSNADEKMYLIRKESEYLLQGDFISDEEVPDLKRQNFAAHYNQTLLLSYERNKEINNRRV